jgi:hypothetical protein
MSKDKPDPNAAGQAGDLQGLSDTEEADSESVVELPQLVAMIPVGSLPPRYLAVRRWFPSLRRAGERLAGSGNRHVDQCSDREYSDRADNRGPGLCAQRCSQWICHHQLCPAW